MSTNGKNYKRKEGGVSGSGRFESDILEKYFQYRSAEEAAGGIAEERAFAAENEHKKFLEEVLSRVADIMGRKPSKDAASSETESGDYRALESRLRKEMEELLEGIGGEEKLEKLRKLEKERLGAFLHEKLRPLTTAKITLRKKINAFIKDIYRSHRQESPVLWEEVSFLEKKIDEIDEYLRERRENTPEGFLLGGILELRRNKKMFARYGVVETPEVRQMYTFIRNDARKKLEGRNGVVALLGGTGTGKTVMARRLAEELSPDGEYEFVSAHAKMTPDDLIDRLGIVPEQVAPEEVPSIVQKALDTYRSENPEAAAEELTEAEDQIRAAVLGQAGTKTMTTKKILEAVGRAAEKGVKVVIDEFNYLPAETLAALNDLLAKTDAKEGFGVIFTGNIGEEFKDRKDLDVALINRILENSLEVATPPQETEKPFIESIVTREKYKEGEKPPSRDLYFSALVQLLDRKGRLIAPERAPEELWNLSEAFSFIQKIAAGESVREGVTGGADQNRGVYSFKKVFLSYRNFNSVVRSWKQDNFSQSLDYYILNNIIRPAEIYAPKESAQLLYLFRQYGFLEGEEVADITVNPSVWQIEGVPRLVDKKAFESERKMKAFSPREVLEAAYGLEMPGFDEVVVDEEERKRKEEEARREELAMEMQEYLEKAQKDFQQEQDRVDVICNPQRFAEKN